MSDREQGNIKNKWIPIEHQFPPFGDGVLICDDTYIYIGYRNRSNQFFVEGKVDEEITDPTHWMYLPDMPV